VYQKFRQVAPTSLFITYTFHPLPDRDRSRVANAVLGLNSTTRDCHITSHRLGQTIRRHPERRGEATVAGPSVSLLREVPRRCGFKLGGLRG